MLKSVYSVLAVEFQLGAQVIENCRGKGGQIFIKTSFLIYNSSWPHTQHRNVSKETDSKAIVVAFKDTVSRPGLELQLC